jgi:hypothetical protein
MRNAIQKRLSGQMTNVSFDVHRLKPHFSNTRPNANPENVNPQVRRLRAWAERVSDAAVQMCRAMNAMGTAFRCGTTSSERGERVR